MHIDNKDNHILILGAGPTPGLDDTTLGAEAKHAINFTKPRKKIGIKFTLQWKSQFLNC